MLRATWIVASAVGVALTGCSATDGWDPATADCTNRVRYHGVVYASYGYTERHGTKYATADQAECHDVGEDAPGSVFPGNPDQVMTWTFAGYPPDKVLGVRFDQQSFAVYVAESVPSGERHRIFRAPSANQRTD